MGRRIRRQRSPVVHLRRKTGNTQSEKKKWIRVPKYSDRPSFSNAPHLRARLNKEPIGAEYIEVTTNAGRTQGSVYPLSSSGRGVEVTKTPLRPTIGFRASQGVRPTKTQGPPSRDKRTIKKSERRGSGGSISSGYRAGSSSSEGGSVLSSRHSTAESLSRHRRSSWSSGQFTGEDWYAEDLLEPRPPSGDSGISGASKKTTEPSQPPPFAYLSTLSEDVRGKFRQPKEDGVLVDKGTGRTHNGDAARARTQLSKGKGGTGHQLPKKPPLKGSRLDRGMDALYAKHMGKLKLSVDDFRDFDEQVERDIDAEYN